MNSAEHNGQADAKVLRWPGKLLSADDLRRHLRGHKELIVQRHAIVTPLAVDELKDRKVRLVREDMANVGKAKTSREFTEGLVAYAQERPAAIVAAAVQSLQREGVSLHAMPACDALAADWALELAECVARGECRSCVAFCSDPGLVCCVANKKPGLRAAAVADVVQAARAVRGLGSNLLALEMPGRTLFEVRQVLLMLHKATSACPAEVAELFQELDGHAHR